MTNRRWNGRGHVTWHILKLPILNFESPKIFLEWLKPETSNLVTPNHLKQAQAAQAYLTLPPPYTTRTYTAHTY